MPPNFITRRAIRGRGIIVMRVSFQSMKRSMTMLAALMKMASNEAMVAIPAAILTALISLVAWAMMSPTRVVS